MSLAPPFTEEIARIKVKKAQDLWNTQHPENVSKAYTKVPAPLDPTLVPLITYSPGKNTVWRNRSSFLHGTDEVISFLTAKWQKEKNYRLRKELFAFGPNKIAVQFWYEYQDSHDGMKWKRCYGLEDWTFDESGLMRKRHMSGNDVEIGEEGRWFKDDVDVNTVEIGEEHW